MERAGYGERDGFHRPALRSEFGNPLASRFLAGDDDVAGAKVVGNLENFALAQRAVGRRTPLLFGLGVLGAALFYGDAAITPAISVLSAVEGLELVAPYFDAYIIPISVAIIVALFWRGRSVAETAMLLGIPETSVAERGLAALRALRSVIEQNRHSG